jgi:GDP-6-deoxy-D-talose 4-dehydrogenase
LRILLTGAGGFTGRHFTAYAQANGHEVVPLRANLMHREAVQAEVRTHLPDTVVHLAAISFVGHTDERAFYAVNVIGAMNLLTALAELHQPPLRVLLASSANVYGNCEVSPISELQTPAPVNHYAVSKLAMEHMASTYLPKLPIVIARPFNYTGSGQSENFVIPKLVDHFVRRADVVELGNLNIEREFNDVHLVCDAYVALARIGGVGETYNVCSGKSYTLQYVIDTLVKLTGHHPSIRTNPTFVRTNEVHRLYGSPAKLMTLLTASRCKLNPSNLEKTLARMLTDRAK